MQLHHRDQRMPGCIKSKIPVTVKNKANQPLSRGLESFGRFGGQKFDNKTIESGQEFPLEAFLVLTLTVTS